MDPKAQNDKKRRVLVVDDDRDFCRLIERYTLSSPDVEIHFAATAHEAVKMIRQDSCYDLVLVDFLLPDSPSGYELRGLCSKGLPESQFAMMSSMPLQLPDIEREDFLQKPCSAADYRAFLEAHLPSPCSMERA